MNTIDAQPSNPFEEEMRVFERADSIAPPSKGQILIYGSSTMRLWTTYAEDLAGYPVQNRGFGGSQMSDAIYFFDRIVVPLQPSLILLYEGDNDMAGGKSPKEVLRDFKTFMHMVKQKLPGTKVAFYTVRPSVAREQNLPLQRNLNCRIKWYSLWHRRSVRVIDAHRHLLTNDGKPDPAFLSDDHLHMNADGYVVWTKLTLDFLKKQGYKKS